MLKQHKQKQLPRIVNKNRETTTNNCYPQGSKAKDVETTQAFIKQSTQKKLLGLRPTICNSNTREHSHIAK